jgi:hypothetical protein
MARPVERMETGAEWAHSYLLMGGRPPVPITVSAWTLVGKVSLAELESTEIPLTEDKLKIINHTITEDDLEEFEGLPVGQEVTLIQVSLTEDDTEILGPGTVEIEIRRTDPRPRKTIIRHRIRNFQGY